MTMLTERQTGGNRVKAEQTALNCDESVGLLVTYQCNLDCKYCYIKEKQNRNMTFETAREILKPFLLKEGTLVEIVFMGAEVLMAEPMIRRIVEWAEQGSWGRRFRFFGSTNGTCLTGELKQWLYRHRESIVLGLSYDGLPAVQQSNRGCAAGIDVDFFIRTWPSQPVQMTITAESVGNMAEGVIYLLKRGAVVHPNVAYEEEQWSREALIQYGRQLKRLIDFYLQNEVYPNISQFEHDLIAYARNLDHPVVQPKVCGAGSGFQVFDVDGSSYPCHILSPLVLRGEKLDGIREGILAKTQDFSDDSCFGCPYGSSCPTCLACNYIYRDNFTKRDRTHCEIMHMEVRAFIKREVARLSAKEHILPEDALQIDAICKILEYERRRGRTGHCNLNGNMA